MPYVFMSYARADAQDELANRFHRELCVEIAQRGGVPIEEASYFDRNIPVGDSWPTALANALGDCKVFLALVSPSYFSSEYCGKEWQAFWNRLADYADEHGEWPNLIVPVVWVPPAPGGWPERTREVQTMKGRLGDAYDTYGMRYLLQNPAEGYQKALVKIATTVIEAGRAHQLTQDRVSPLSLTENFFVPGDPSRLPLPHHENAFVTSYLRLVRENHERLKFGDPTSPSYSGQVESAQRGRMRLSDVFIMPSVAPHTQVVTGTSDSHPSPGGQSAQEALDSPDNRRVVVLGPPGTGKTTLVHYLVHNLAYETAGNVAETSCIPIHVRVAEVRQRASHIMTLLAGVHEIERRRDHVEKDEALVQFLATKIERGEAVLYLDGLDEVPADLLDTAIRAITEVADRYDQCRIIVTCREYDYANLPDSQRLPFPEVTLLPFDIGLINKYVERWYEAYTRLQPWGNVDDKRRQLKERIRDNDDLQDLAKTPILLTLITLMSVTTGMLPARRSSLYYQMVRQLLMDRPPWRAPEAASARPVEEILPIAALVANRLQQRASEASSQAAKGFTMAELQTIIAGHVGLRPDSPPHEYSRALGEVSQYLERITQANGLIVHQGNGILQFAHRSLQEFLAGLHFLNGADYETGLACADQAIWRQPLLLMAEHGANEGQSLFYLVKFMTDLVNMSSESSERSDQSLLRSVVVAEMLDAIGRETLIRESYGRVCARQGGGAPETGLWHRVVEELHRAAVERGEDLRAGLRVRALFALGNLGDPRFIDEDGAVRRPDPNEMVQLHGGTFRVGTEAPEVVRRSRLQVAPVREVRLGPCFIGRYPVVNAEYRAFIDDDGYLDDRYWDTEEARLWLHGDEAFIDMLYRDSRSSFERDFQPELRDHKHSQPELLNNLRRMAASRKEPFFWGNHRLNQPNQPVVGVNWWEARAYCRWLNLKRRAQGIDDGLTFRLPTEHEWERATRPDSEPREYPWGDEPPNGTRACYRGGDLTMQRATPVGAFPAGTWEGGPHDLAGNVWEWTASKAIEPGAEKDPERDQPLGMSDRVIRGGSWYALVPTAAMHTSYRGVDRLQNVYVDLGFRVAASRSAEAEDPAP